MDDAALADAFRRTGDRQAFETLVLRHLATLRRFLAVQFAGDPAGASDAEQEVLIRLHGSLGRWRGDGLFTTWLFVLARRAAADEIRRRVRERRRTEGFARRSRPEDELREAEADPARAWDREQTGLGLRRALAELPEPDRTMLYLKDAEGMPVDELCRVYGLKEGTMKSRLSRARSRLKDLLEEERYA